MPLSLKDALKRICELQPAYSADNTPAMQERGTLIRDDLREAIEGLQGLIAPRLGPFGEDFLVSASDGIGRKTELPWVRFCSRSMSPRPTEGFYSVVHFSTDGSAVHVTVGCGSSRFYNGYSVVLPDHEIDAQTEWVRTIVRERFGSLEPFTDGNDFGATRNLPRSFQRATAMSKRVAYDEIDQTDVEGILVLAADRLRAVYDGQTTGRDLSPADQAEQEIAEVIRPTSRSGRRQGIGLSAEARKAVELHAMRLASEWLASAGFAVTDTSSTKPYDLEATKGDQALKVEVKGTTSDRADAILMTSNEVDLHRAEVGKTGLIVVSKIILSGTAGSCTTSGGLVDSMLGWDIGDWDLQPTAFRLTKRP